MKFILAVALTFCLFQGSFCYQEDNVSPSVELTREGMRMAQKIDQIFGLNSDDDDDFERDQVASCLTTCYLNGVPIFSCTDYDCPAYATCGQCAYTSPLTCCIGRYTGQYYCCKKAFRCCFNSLGQEGCC